ncbi:MAG TPA: DUF2953 domain-containing protein [Candidatus Faeciplasma pullistercoris]|uniref:DUF2953 domain-containing protein n=1 Tax=Candidatus Faeciplasma pullistercoris TaxID=2840800 RepID=A0A9D1GU68_9FIRM|nr:DUF2953 domain-containing protein [Candidatus Faeciplasma pullistercoris]
MGIVAGLIAVISILLSISVRADIAFDKGGVSVAVKYLWFKLYSFDARESTGKEDKDGQSDKSVFRTGAHKKSGGADKSKKASKTAAQPDGSAGKKRGGAETEHSGDEKQKGKPSDLDKEDVSRTQQETQASQTTHASQTTQASQTTHASSEEKDGAGGKLDELKQKWQEVKPFVPVAKKGFKKLLRLIRLRQLDIWLKVGGEDAYEAGMNFGRANQIFYPALSLVCCIFSVKIKHTEIRCDFEHEGFDFGGSVLVLVRPAAVLGLAIYLGINYLKIKKKLGKKDTENE